MRDRYHPQSSTDIKLAMSPDIDTMGSSASTAASERTNGASTSHVIDSFNGPAPPVQSPHTVNGFTSGFHDAVPELVNGDATDDMHHTSDATITKSPFLRPTSADSVYDLVCIGFGPASLAIAIALHDEMEAGKLTNPPKVLFLEKQSQFAWHAGMLLPGAKMQISFIKDLASLRNPRSNFTFLNYLHKNDRLVEFTNLDTFLPARIEFEDYLRWCARHFDDVVQYQNEVLSVSPVQEDGPARLFGVKSRDTQSGETTTYQARNVVLALGGQPSIPKSLPHSERVIHSSQYAQAVPRMLTNPSASYRVAVIGAGQSAAEIFNNIQNLYPNSKTSLIMRSEFLKPSDDSPFVNSIFNPQYIDRIYPKSSAYRAAFLEDARATNYSVVRLELIEHLYEKMYHQRRTLGKDERAWPHRILAGRRIVNVTEKGEALRIKTAVCHLGDEDGLLGEEQEVEELDVDLIICATGYQRRAHVEMLKGCWGLLPSPQDASGEGRKDRWVVEGNRVMEVERDYSVKFEGGKVESGSGVWLQGCCEGTHGLSDTLLSVLSTRSGEMVGNIFGKRAGRR